MAKSAVIPSSKLEPIRTEAFSGSQDIATTPQMFGADLGKAQAAQTAQVAGNVASGAKDWFAIQQNILDNQNKADLLASETSMMNFEYNLLHNTDGYEDANGDVRYGLLTRKGVNARGSTQEVQARWQEFIKNNSLRPNDPNFLAVKGALEKAKLRSLRSVSQHENTQTEKARSEGITASIAAYGKSSVVDALSGDLDRVELKLNSIARRVEQKSQIEGWTGEQTEIEQEKAFAAVHTGIITAFLDKKDPEAAQRYIEHFKNMKGQNIPGMTGVSRRRRRGLTKGEQRGWPVVYTEKGIAGAQLAALEKTVFAALVDSRGYTLFQELNAARASQPGRGTEPIGAVEMEKLIWESKGASDDVKKAAIAAAKRHYGNQEYDKKISDRANVQRALELIIGDPAKGIQGMSFENLPASLTTAIPGTKLSFLRSLADDIRKGVNYPLDYKVYYSLARMDADKFLKVDLMDDGFRKKLDHTTWEKMVNRQIKLRDGIDSRGRSKDVKADAERRKWQGDSTIMQVVTRYGQNLKLKKLRLSGFQQNVDLEVQQFRQNNNGDAPTQEQLTAIMDRQAIEVNTRWWSADRRVTDIIRMGDTDDIPPEYYDDLAAAVQNADGEATLDDIKRLWTTIQENDMPDSTRDYIVQSFKKVHPNKNPTPLEIQKGFRTLALNGILLPTGYLKTNIMRQGGG